MSNKKGFTLIEILIVISIIGILAAIILVSLNNVNLKSRDAQRQSDLVQIQKAIEVYYSYVGHYPDCGDTYINGDNDCLTIKLRSAGVIGASAKIPTDPRYGVGATPAYQYSAGSFNTPAEATQYMLRSTLESSSLSLTNNYPSSNHCDTSGGGALPACQWFEKNGRCVYKGYGYGAECHNTLHISNSCPACP